MNGKNHKFDTKNELCQSNKETNDTKKKSTLKTLKNVLKTYILVLTTSYYERKHMLSADNL